MSDLLKLSICNNFAMDIGLLKKTAKMMVAPGKGILAADESSGTCQKRFESVGVPCTEENRRAYRETLLTADGLEQYISGVILYDETIRQETNEGEAFAAVLEKKGILPGIKVDAGLKDLALHAGEKVTEGVILKTSMIITGKKAAQQAGMEEVAKETVRAFEETLPASLAGVAFLSGGQTDEQATEHLNAMNKGGKLPWPLSFSYGRALQNPVLKIWAESPNANIAKAQEALLFRSKMNSLATQGKYSPDMEKERPY